MARASSEQTRLLPWYAKAGAASGIVPLSRFVSPQLFALKNGGYGCLFSLTGIDEESMTDQELETRTRAVEGALRGLPADAVLTQYSRVLSGYEIPRKAGYGDPVLESFVRDRVEYLSQNAGFRAIDLFWCLTVEPSQKNPLDKKTKDAAVNTARQLAALQKAAGNLETQLAPVVWLRLLPKQETFEFFSYLFNLEPWAMHSRMEAISALIGKSYKAQSPSKEIISVSASATCRRSRSNTRPRSRVPASSLRSWRCAFVMYQDGGDCVQNLDARFGSHQREKSAASPTAVDVCAAQYNDQLQPFGGVGGTLNSHARHEFHGASHIGGGRLLERESV